ncbi:uncharacterized protein LOC126901053 isoform X2 [Daktulosphaira vitifoliae]|uniref:uncharacterized protein LOC126901053 isoform X2 n=1 Tax=Daktulosphaira vitifoliae TaxID=58002 RepID=UPI0021AA1F52|nr:uncharacterized protein LOC126901053 isoform X2 [Daktulosphaira vitifoliae]
MYIIKLIISNNYVTIPSRCEIINDEDVDFVIEYVDLPFYYTPVDKEWCREKCKSLGFTYQEPIMNQKLTSNMFPVDVFFDNQGFFIVLSELICRDIKINHNIHRNIIENLIKNENIKKFVNNDSWFENNITSVNKNPYIEMVIFAAAYYLDVCIYVFKKEYDAWIYFRKGWPNYNEIDMKNEKCIYLYMDEDHTNFMTNNYF